MKKIVFFSLVILLLVGCRQTKPLVVHDTAYVNKTEYVTVATVDSVYIDKWHTITEEGRVDSIFIYRYRSYVDTVKMTDTVYKVKEVPVEVPVAKKSAFGTKVVIFATLIVIGALVAAFLWFRKKWKSLID